MDELQTAQATLEALRSLENLLNRLCDIFETVLAEEEDPPRKPADEAMLAVSSAMIRLCEVLERALAPNGRGERVTPINEPGRCPYCSGAGVLGDGQYCSCNMGKDLKRAEQYKGTA
jgi:hypothetical protein